jgi:hypothetical protein
MVVRDESNNVATWYYSIDGGYYWSTDFSVQNSDGKGATAATPRGSVVTLGRNNVAWNNLTGGWRTIFNVSYDRGRTWGTQANLDTHLGAYMYGGAVYSPYIDKIITVHSREFQHDQLDPPAATENVGPCELVLNTWTES